MDAKLLKQKKLKQLLELKKQSANGDKKEVKASRKEESDSEEERQELEQQESLEADEIDGRLVKEVEIMDEEVIVPVLKKKHLLKHFSIKQTVESFFTGGNLHFCKARHLVYAQRDSTVVRFNLESRIVETEISHNDEEIANFAINPKDTHIATFTKNSMLRYIKIEEKRIVHSAKCMGFYAMEMVFDKSGALLIMGDPRGQVQIYELRTFKPVQQFKAHAAGLLGLKLLSTSDRFGIYTFGRDRGVLVYDIKQGEPIQRYEKDAVSFSALAVEEEGNVIAAAGFDGNVHVWDTQDQKYLGKQITCLEIFSFTLKKENTKKVFLIAGTEKGLVRVWVLDHKKPSNSPKFEFLTTNKLEIVSMIILRDERKFVFINLEKAVMVLGFKSFANDSPVFLVEDEIPGCTDTVLDVKFIKMADEKDTRNDLIAVATNSDTLKIYDLSTNANQFCSGHSDMIMCLDTRQEFVLSGSKDCSAKLWRIDRRDDSGSKSNNPKFRFDVKLLCTFRGHQLPIISLHISPKDGAFFLSGSEDKTVKKWLLPDEVYSATSAKVMKQAKRTIVSHEKQVNVVRVSHNGKISVSASHDKKIVLYNSSDLSTRVAFKGHKRGIWDVAFSPFEKILASVAGDRLIKLLADWNIEDGSLLHTLEGHVTTVLKVCFATLGSQILSASADGLVKVWNYKKGLCMNTFEGHEGRVWAMDFTERNEGALLITGDNGNKLLVWRDSTEEEAAKNTEENQTKLRQMHEIDMLLSEEKFEQAIKLAFELGLTRALIKSFQAFFTFYDYISESIFTAFDAEDVLMDEETITRREQEAHEIVVRCVRYFLETDATKFLVFIRDINTKNCYCQISTRLLYALLSIYDLRKLSDLHDKLINQESSKIRLSDIIGVINLYSQRHYERYREHLRRLQFLQFMVTRVGFLTKKGATNSEMQIEDLIGSN